jgi:hypothetical protein
MKPHAQWLALIALALATSAASAQFVKGNEAVRALPGGGKQVETAPDSLHEALRCCRWLPRRALAHGGNG